MINKSSVLLTAFRGTSSEKLAACFDDTYKKIILENDKDASVEQLVNALLMLWKTIISITYSASGKSLL